MVELAYAILVLSVPFMFGVIVGRGIRRPTPTLEHLFGSKIIAALTDVATKRQFVGVGMIVSNTMHLDVNGRTIAIEVRERT